MPRLPFHFRAIRVFVVLGFASLGAASAFAQYMDHHPAPRHHGGGGAASGAAIGAGIGVGIGVIDALIKSERNRQIESEIKAQIDRSKSKKRPPRSTAKKGNDKASQPRQVKKDTPSSAPKKGDSALSVKKDESKSGGGIEQVAYAPPVFPAVTLANCDDCLKLWQSILAYQEILNEDTRKLANRKQELINRQAELERLKQRAARAAAAWDREYFTRLVSITEGSIDNLEEGIERLQGIIDDEWRILRERIAQYEACVDRHCPKPLPVAETPPVVPAPPVAMTPQPPPVAVSTPPQPERHSRVDLPPNDGRKICGPDVTDLVLNVLKEMKKEYEGNPDRQVEACRSLLDPNTAKGAWDIYQLSPAVAAKDYEYNPATDFYEGKDDKSDTKKPWFTGISNMCAIPRPVCGHTVEFMGTCQHAQVVNYVQWGMMLSLCGGAYPMLGNVAHRIWNAIEYNNNAPVDQQRLMILAAQEFNAELDKKRDGGPDLSGIMKRLQDDDGKMTHDNQQCSLKCELTASQKSNLNTRPFGFRWVGLKDTGFRDRSTNEEMVDHVRDLGEKALEHMRK